MRTEQATPKCTTSIAQSGPSWAGAKGGEDGKTGMRMRIVVLPVRWPRYVRAVPGPAIRRTLVRSNVYLGAPPTAAGAPASVVPIAQASLPFLSPNVWRCIESNAGWTVDCPRSALRVPALPWSIGRAVGSRLSDEGWKIISHRAHSYLIPAVLTLRSSVRFRRPGPGEPVPPSTAASRWPTGERQ